MSCSFYRDVKGREYYLPSETIARYQNDKRPHTLPQGVKKYECKDRRVVYFQHPYEYPEAIKRLQMMLSTLTFEEFQGNIANIHQSCNVYPLPVEIYTLLLSYLDKSSLACFYLTSRFFRSLFKNKPDLKNLSINALRDKHLQLFLWSRKFNPPKPAWRVCEIAAQQNNLPLLIQLHALDYPIKRSILFCALDSLAMIKYLKEHTELEYQCIFEYAAAKGDEEMFRWAKGAFPKVKGRYLAQAAARSGSVPILQMIAAAGLLYRERVYMGAVEGSSFQVLEWLKRIDLPPPPDFANEPEVVKNSPIQTWLINNWGLTIAA